jgi:predicted nucleic acid-binding protein
MRYVVDCSVGVKWVLQEVDSDKALRFRDAGHLAGEELIAPDWFVLEAMNVLGKAAARGVISAGDALQHHADVVMQVSTYHPALPLANAAFQLALQHRRAVYDCLYLALALREQCQLVTADDALVRQLQPVYGCLVALSSLP